MKLQGIFSAIATPFDHTGNLYHVKVEHNIGRWNRTGLAGYVATATTGEGVLLAAQEKVSIWELVAKSTGSSKILIAGVAADGVRETVCLTNRAAELGFKAALVETPHYYRDVMEQPAAQMLYFRSVADRTKIPILICERAGHRLEVDTVLALSQHPNIAGISTADVKKIREVSSQARTGFQVLAGSTAALWDGLQSGATGAILGFSNAAPYATITIWEAHRTREEQAGADWQSRIATAAELVSRKYGIAGLKHAMDVNGYYGGPPRLPLSVPSPQAKREIEDAFRDLKG